MPLSMERALGQNRQSDKLRLHKIIACANLFFNGITYVNGSLGTRHRIICAS